MDFRQFCTEMWYMHKKECLQWERKLPDYEAKDYFARNRWMLRKLYRSSCIKESNTLN